jgi:hypothetical protein
MEECHRDFMIYFGDGGNNINLTRTATQSNNSANTMATNSSNNGSNSESRPISGSQFTKSSSSSSGVNQTPKDHIHQIISGILLCILFSSPLPYFVLIFSTFILIFSRECGLIFVFMHLVICISDC